MRFDERLEGGEEGGEFIGSKAVFGVFGGEFDFDEDGERFVEGLGGCVESDGGFRESSVSMAWNNSAALVVLLFWRGPIRWTEGDEGRAWRIEQADFECHSWTRFSPKRLWPAAWASRMASAGCILLTAMRATVLGSRWARAQASAIWLRICSRFAAMDMVV